VASLKVTFFDNSAQSLEGLEHYSHVWLIFFFHLNDNVAVKPKVRAQAGALLPAQHPPCAHVPAAEKLDAL
jgi:tRNA (Thr-GGU) A37 N-methylase